MSDSEYRLVQITEADIRSGVRANFRLCPFAQALNRQYPGESVPWGVGATRAWGSSVDDGWELSRAAQRFIHRFDLVQPVSSAVFRIRKIPEAEIAMPRNER